jgi:hypothetical protein
VVAAPREGGGPGAAALAAEIARRTGFGLVTDSAPTAELDARVREAARGPVRWYAEIHADGRAHCAGRIEIATRGVDDELALRLRALAELIRDAHLRARPRVERLDVTVASTDGRRGLLRGPGRTLRIELPGCARRDFRDAYAAILAELLVQSVRLTGGR